MGVGSKFEELKRMRCIGGFLAFISFFSGLASAYYWYLSSRVPVAPAWKPDIDEEKEKNQMAWVLGGLTALHKSGTLNKSAALWAALAVATGAAASTVSYFSK
jgi:hypothetical protein